MPPRELVVKRLGLANYECVWLQMKQFTEERSAATHDELWLVEHYPIFTLGQAGKKEHLLAPGDIPIVRTDRGGQVTYHGPGQLIAYLLFDLKRLNITVRDLVSGIEESIINLLSEYGIDSEVRKGAPGVYVAERKIAALGLRIRKGCSFHGLSLNIDMDLEPFARIKPCGFEGLEVVQLSQLGVTDNLEKIAGRLAGQISQSFGYDSIEFAGAELNGSHG